MAKAPTPNQAPSRPGAQPLILIATQQHFNQHQRLEDEVVDVLLDEATRRNWRLLDLSKTGGSISGEPDPAGALVTLLPTDDRAQWLRAIGCPTVRLGKLPHPQDELMPVAIPDHRGAARMAAAYFAQRGFTQLGLIGHKEAMATPMLDETLNEQAQPLGYAYQSRLFETGNRKTPSAERYDRRARALTEWLDGLTKPVGLVAASSAIAVMVSVACRRAGLSVPEEVAILSIGDDRADCQLCPVPISAVQASRADVARASVQLLDDVMQGKPSPTEPVLVPPRGVITRRSTDILAVNDPTVARAIRYMWDHLDASVCVDDVANAMKTPRYKLERLFKKHLKRGVYSELRRARLERFSELLRTTDQTIDELAPQVGYQSSKRLHGVFREEFGMTPRKYRLANRDDD